MGSGSFEMWELLSIPWRTSLELAWEAYCDDCYPIGAIVTDADGKILARGRNRVYPRSRWVGRMPGVAIAHAEVEALQQLGYAGIDPHTSSLYTTTEPCAMCLGVFYMSGLRTLHFASREPFAGSVNILGTTRYLSRKKIKICPPFDPVLEMIIMAMAVEHDCSHGSHVEFGNEVHDRWAEVIPGGVQLGHELLRSGELRRLREEGASMSEVVNRLAILVK